MPEGVCAGCAVVPPMAADCASDLQRPWLKQADGECAKLALRAYTPSRPVRARDTPQGYLVLTLNWHTCHHAPMVFACGRQGPVRRSRRGRVLVLRGVYVAPRGMAECASDLQLSRKEHAYGECAEFSLRAHTPFRPVRAVACPLRLLAAMRVRWVGPIGSAPSAARGSRAGGSEHQNRGGVRAM